MWSTLSSSMWAIFRNADFWPHHGPTRSPGGRGRCSAGGGGQAVTSPPGLAVKHRSTSGSLAILESCAGVCLQGPRLSSSPPLSAIPLLWYLLAVFMNPCISIINHPKLVRWPAGHTQCAQDSSGGCLGPPHTRETLEDPAGGCPRPQQHWCSLPV